MSEPIRVLQLLVSTRLGGGPKQVFETIRRLPREEFEWAVGAPDDGPWFRRFARIATVHRAAVGRLGPRALLEVVRLVRETRAEVVHSHGKSAGLWGRLAARATGRPAVHTFHGIHLGRHGTIGARAYLALERALSRLSFAVVSVSASQFEAGRRLALWPADRGVLVVSGVDAEATRGLAERSPLGRAALGLPPTGPVVACVARFDAAKGVDVFVRAMEIVAARHPSAVGLVVGGGPEEATVRRLAAPLGGRLVLAGEIEDAARILGAVDVYVSASRVEGLPLAVLEAMACGVPIAATRIPAHEEILVEGVTALLARREDPAHVAEIVLRLLADRDLAQGLAAHARADVEARFPVDATATALGALYRRAGGRPAGDPARPAPAPRVL